jgi:nitrogen regulatory protein P-II 1
VVTDGDLDKVIQTFAQTAKTGQVGDGKIFVSTLDNVVRIRTGESGDHAV